MKYIYLIIMVLATTIISCDHRYKPLSIKGKWSYIDLQNNYSEFWISNDSVAMTIDATSYNIYYYKYDISNDSLFLYEKYSNPKQIDSFKIEILDKNKIGFKNNLIKIVLTRFEKLAKIDTAKVFKNKVYSDFGKRLDKFLKIKSIK